MCKFIFSFTLIFFRLNGQSQDPIIELVKNATVKVIKAVDLKVQRSQNETIWLQNAQQVLENALSKIKLEAIGSWVKRQKDLYGEYFDELWRVKDAVATYRRIAGIVRIETLMITEYKKSYGLLRQDAHFSAEELLYMSRVYAGILDAGAQCIAPLAAVISAFAVQMDDAQRLRIIDEAADKVQQHYHALLAFNRQNALLSMQRARDADEIEILQKIYGLK